jgi:hypothetical protein
MRVTNRRSLLKQVSLASALSCPGVSILAQTVDVEREKASFRKLNVPADSKNVAIFFDFSCSYCADLHPTLVQWGSTVPKTIKVEHFPVVNVAVKASMTEQVISARAFYAASTLARPDQLKRFTELAYESRARYVSDLLNGSGNGSREQGASPLSTVKFWVAAAQTVGINKDSFLRLLQSTPILNLAKASALKLIEYNISETPSVGIGGRYMLTPNRANGNPEMFFNLLNGFVTEIV